ncbi:MAG: spore germination protein [Clostridia bacterium]|nr:spore germination protein [Clostridia bacterium]
MGFGIFVQLIVLSNLKSFGVSYFSPYLPIGNKDTVNKFYINPIWRRNKRSDFLNTKKPDFEGTISMEWKNKP